MILLKEREDSTETQRNESGKVTLLRRVCTRAHFVACAAGLVTSIVIYPLLLNIQAYIGLETSVIFYIWLVFVHDFGL